MKEIIGEILAVMGFLVSLYILYVEKKLKKSENYKAFCDISDKLSCEKAIRSPYSNILYLSNSIVAAIFYGVLFCFIMTGHHFIVKSLSLAAFVISIGMAYILFFKIKTACPLCISLYLINILLFVLFWII